MQTVLIVVHLLIVIALVGVVLLQRSEGGLGLGGGSAGVGGLMTGRGQANALTRATAILAGAFFLTSITLSVVATQNRAPSSVLDGLVPSTQQPAPGAPSAPAPAPGGNLLDQLRQMQDQSGPQPPQPSAPPAQ